MGTNPNKDDISSLSLSDDTQSHDIVNNDSLISTSVEYEEYSQTPINNQSVNNDGRLNTGLKQGNSKSGICIGGSSFNRPELYQFGGLSSHNASDPFPGHRLSPELGVEQSTPGSNPATQNQFYQQQHRETTFSVTTRLQTVSQQQKGSDDVCLGCVRCPQYAALATRLGTFSNWPLDTSQTPDKVAEAGFYYTGHEDIVRCFACDGGLEDWDPEDDPWIEHARWFPQCPYVQHIKGEKFINLVRMMSEESDEEDDNAVCRGAVCRGAVCRGATWRGAGNANINLDSDPTRPQAVSQQQYQSDDLCSVLRPVRSTFYADFNLRHKTFSNFPACDIVNPMSLAEAGFYYTGFLDAVRCFACDGSLKNWDPDDDPWAVHARWFPKCPYVRHMKGEKFINFVSSFYEELGEDEDYRKHTERIWQESETTNTILDSVSNDIKMPSLESKDVQCVFELGFSKEDVAMSINYIFRKGKQDFTVLDIIDVLLEEQSSYEQSVNGPQSQVNSSDTKQGMLGYNHLKELVLCTECKIKQVNILFLPCTHHIVCESCSTNLQICTKCNRKIKEKVRTYMP